MSKSAAEEAAPPLLRLHVVEGPQAGKQLEAARGTNQLGRAAKVALSIRDHSISERHAEVAWREGAWCLRDLGSTNGTAVNGRALAGDPSGWLALKSGDLLRLGADTVARVEVAALTSDAATVEEFVLAECAQLEQRIRARAEQLANQLRSDWQQQKKVLLMNG